MKRTTGLLLATLLLGGAIGCAARQQTVSVRVPPRIDLKEHETIGVVQFSTAAKGDLASYATRRFTEEARRDQGLVRMVEFGSAVQLLRAAGGEGPGPEAYRRIGRERGVETIFVGELTVSDVRPDLRLSSLRSGSLTAQVDATLAVKMIEASTGASLWSASASATRSVGHVSVFQDGNVAFDADDPELAYGDLIDYLVGEVTYDFRAGWETQVVPTGP